MSTTNTKITRQKEAVMYVKTLVRCIHMKNVKRIRRRNTKSINTKMKKDAATVTLIKKVQKHIPQRNESTRMKETPLNLFGLRKLESLQSGGPAGKKDKHDKDSNGQKDDSVNSRAVKVWDKVGKSKYTEKQDKKCDNNEGSCERRENYNDEKCRRYSDGGNSRPWEWK